jgi:hypothetical protein
VTRTLVALWLFQATTIALAFLLCKKRPQHRPFAVWALVALLADILRCLSAIPFPWLLREGPFHGLKRAVFHADQALFLLEPVGLAAIAWIVFLARRPWAPLAAGVVLWLVLVLGYPTLRLEPLARAYAIIQGGAILVSLGTLVLWMRRKAPPRTEHAAVSLATVIAIALYDGPYAPSVALPFWSWESAQTIFLVLWAGQALLHTLALWRGGFGLVQQAPGRRPDARSEGGDDDAAHVDDHGMGALVARHGEPRERPGRPGRSGAL